MSTLGAAPYSALQPVLDDLGVLSTLCRQFSANHEMRRLAVNFFDVEDTMKAACRIHSHITKLFIAVRTMFRQAYLQLWREVVSTELCLACKL